MNIGPDDIKDSRLPIGSVSWNEAVTYFKTIGGRLPTEIEWEYAKSAGTTAKQYGLADAIAWHSGNSRSLLHPVGLKQANAFGLFDMLGNVAEWTADDYDSGHISSARRYRKIPFRRRPHGVIQG